MEFLESLLTGPVLPATCLLGLMMFWSGLALLGTVDLDMPGGDMDFDLDLDVDTGGVHAADGFALLALRWLNLKDVPLVLWLGILSIIWWVISSLLWTLVEARFLENPGWLWSGLLAGGHLMLALPLTKLATSPMTKWFISERLTAANLVGQECEISSLEATPEFGQVKYKTEGAPLLLNVRTDGAHLVRGARVWITHYDAKRRTYIVSPTGTDGKSIDSAVERQ